MMLEGNDDTNNYGEEDIISKQEAKMVNLGNDWDELLKDEFKNEYYITIICDVVTM